MERCIAATEAINSLRSLLGYHPGQRVEARVKLLGDGSAAAEFRTEFERWKLTRRPGQGREPRISRAVGRTQDGMVSAVLGWARSR